MSRSDSIKRWIMSFLDGSGFIIALTVQIGVMVVSMGNMSVNPWYKAGFIGIGVAAVLFAPRAFSKGRQFRYRFNWAMFAIVTVFFSWSFALSGTATQSKLINIVVTEYTDSQLLELKEQKKGMEEIAQGLVIEFNQSSRAETIASIQARQDENNLELSALNNSILSRISYITSGQATADARQSASTESASKIFTAIPDAWKQGRIIELIIWGILFIGIELMIINSLGEAKEAEEYNPIVSVAPETSDKLTAYSDYRFDNISESGALAPKHAVVKHVEMTIRQYRDITQQAIDFDLIIVKGSESFPATGITKEEFIKRMEK